MKYLLVWMFAFCWLAAVQPARAAHFPPRGMVKVCAAKTPLEIANCDAFLRGSVERMEMRATPGKIACRRTPFGPKDVADFLNYSSHHMIPDSGEAIAQAFDYWAHNRDSIPCNDVPGYWTAGHLLGLCEQDNKGFAPCKFYTTALLQESVIEQAANNIRFFCPKGNRVRSDDELLNVFRSWVAGAPERAEQPAAIAYIDALRAAYPC
jgi:hypothetical protein